MKSFATTIFPMDVKLKLSTRKVWEWGALALEAVCLFS